MRIEEVTKKKIWEDFIRLYKQGSYPFFQSWSWSEVLNGLQVPVQRLGLYDGKTLWGVLLIVEVQAKRGHYFYIRQGPVLKENTPDLFVFFLDYAKNIAKKKKASFIRISRFLKDDVITELFFKKYGFINSLLQIADAQVCPVLDITQSEEALLMQMRKSHRYLIKKAKTMPVEIIKGVSQKDLQAFLVLLNTLSHEKNFVVHHEIEKEFDVFMKHKQCLLLLAKFEEKIIAGAFIDYAGDSAFYRHGASDYAYKNIPASYLLQWEAILNAKKRGIKRYNFFGIAPENAHKNHPWQGFTLFKTGFGGYNEYYYNVLDLPLNVLYWKNYAADWVSKLKKGY